MNWKYCLILIAALYLNSCASQDRSLTQEFISKYGNSDFMEFKNYDVFVRSYEERGKNACVMIMSSKDTGVCGLPYTLIIEKQSFRILETRKNDREGQQCKLDTVIAKKLAVELLKMNINGIGVDSNNNVFVNIKFSDEIGAELIKFSDEKFIADVHKKNYKPVEGNWYERKE